jgi:hypothetical protein
LQARQVPNRVEPLMGHYTYGSKWRHDSQRFDIQHNDTLHRAVMLIVVFYDACRVLFIIILYTVMLLVVMLYVAMLNVVMLSVIMLIAIMLSAIMLSAIMLSAIMMSAIMLNANTQNVIMLSVIMLSVVMQCHGTLLAMPEIIKTL